MGKIRSVFARYEVKDTAVSSGIDLWLILSIIPIMIAGLITMYSFTGDNSYASSQIIWILVGLAVFFIVQKIDVRPIRSTKVLVIMYMLTAFLLLSLFIFGTFSRGTTGWLSFGLFSLQPADLAKIVLIVVLAKYFSRRHIEIANFRHIIISGIYAFLLFILIIAQPDLGSAVVIFLIWFGMVMVSGLSKKHFLFLFISGVLIGILAWNFGLAEYQKNRIRNFIDPYSDIRGSGYNAYQSSVAVGSGQLWGKGLGYGTQSRLKFLPEYQTDFIFAAYAEEWGFMGVLILLGLYGIIIWRILLHSMRGATNFEILYGTGVAIYFIVHFTINISMNMHLLPVTGIPLPFMSYGGTHLVTECLALGILMSMGRYARPAHRDAIKNEFAGPV